MPNLRRFDLDELATRPGTYVNPDTEVVIIVDDGAAIDAELFAGDAEGWVLVSDDLPVDESRRDELVERLHVRAGRTAGVAPELDDHDHDDVVEGPDDELAAAGFAEQDPYDEE